MRTHLLRRARSTVLGLLAAGLAASLPPADATTVVKPPVNGQFDYQIGGAYRPATGVRIVDRDRSERPTAGLYSICYVNAFQTQPEEAAWWKAHHRELLLTKSGGGYVGDPDWPGEILLDTSSAAKRSAIAAVVGSWVDRCAAAGFQAVEPDNLDSWTRSGRRLTKAGNLAYAHLLAVRAHRTGLAFAQKNAAGLTRSNVEAVGFDFAIAEECQVYNECGAYTSRYGRRVIEIEYTDNPRSAYTAACAARGASISVILRDRDVVPATDRAYRYAAC